MLADGTFVVASADENSDLFWAIRGGGGNFGVVTSFLFQAHPVHTVCAGPMLWELDQTADMMKWYREFIVQAPEEINGFFAVMTVPPAPPFPEALHLKKMCAIVWCYPGTMEQANEILEPVRSFRRPAFEFFVPMPFPMLQGMFDGLYPPGLQWYWKADFVKELSDDAIAQHVQHAAKLPSMFSTMHLYPVNGAAHRVGNSETPFSYRDAVWSQVIVGVDPDPANREAITTWARDYYDALHPYGAGGAYVNFMMEEGEDRIRATYRGNYDRLAAIKAKYDPGQLLQRESEHTAGGKSGGGVGGPLPHGRGSDLRLRLLGGGSVRGLRRWLRLLRVSSIPADRAASCNAASSMTTGSGPASNVATDPRPSCRLPRARSSNRDACI